MLLSEDDVHRIAQLARIEISAGEARAMQGQLERIFELIGQMQQVTAEGVEPMAHAQDAELRLRDDVVTETPDRERLQAVAPEVADGLYLVPKVIE